VAATSPASLGGALLDLLQKLLGAHETLLGQITEHRQAMAGADPRAMQDALEAQARTLTEIGELDSRRSRLVQEMIRGDARLGAMDRSGKTPTLSDVATLLPEPQRTRALRLAETLRERIALARREQRAGAMTAQALAAHMDGLLQLVQRRIAGKDSYAGVVRGARGSRSGGTPIAASAIDLTQ